MRKISCLVHIMLLVCVFTCLCIFRACHLSLDNQLMCSSLGRIPSPALSCPQLPGVLCVGVLLTLTHSFWPQLYFSSQSNAYVSMLLLLVWSWIPGNFFSFHLLVNYSYMPSFLPFIRLSSSLFITAYCTPGLEIHTSLLFWACPTLNWFSISQIHSLWLMASALIQLPQGEHEVLIPFLPAITQIPLALMSWPVHPNPYFCVYCVYACVAPRPPYHPTELNEMLLNLLVYRIHSIHTIHPVNSAGGELVHR